MLEIREMNETVVLAGGIVVAIGVFLVILSFIRSVIKWWKWRKVTKLAEEILQQRMTVDPKFEREIMDGIKRGKECD